MPDQLQPLESWFLDVEEGHDHMHIASVTVFEGPPPSLADLRDGIRRKLPLVPRCRQVVQRAPLDLVRPVWVDAPEIDLDYHVRRTAVPPPGGWAELRALFERVVSQELDRTRPLWEFWMVEGLPGGQWAILGKVHHAMVDGVAGVNLLALVLDATPEPLYPPDDGWQPAPSPGLASRLTGSAAELARAAATRPAAVAGMALRAARHPVRSAGAAARFARGSAEFLHVLAPNRVTSVNAPLGSHRAWDAVRVDLDSVKEVARGHDATVNDVALAAVAGGFRTLLRHREEEVAPELTLRCGVPVNVRREGEHGLDNRVSILFVELPVGLDDRHERVREVRDQMRRHKRQGDAEVGERLLSLANHVPSPILELGLRAGSGALRRLGHHRLHTLVTNVPGPQVPLYALGRQMLAAYPFVPIAEHVAITVSLLSYDGTLSLAVTGDRDASPDVDVLVTSIGGDLEALGARSRVPLPAER